MTDIRHARYSLIDVAHLRSQGQMWKAIGERFGFASAQPVLQRVECAFERWYAAQHPPPPRDPWRPHQHWYVNMKTARRDGLDRWLLEQVGE